MVNEPHCSFCTRPLVKTFMLIAGNSETTHICDECLTYYYLHILMREVERRQNDRKPGSPSG